MGKNRHRRFNWNPKPTPHEIEIMAQSIEIEEGMTYLGGDGSDLLLLADKINEKFDVEISDKDLHSFNATALEIEDYERQWARQYGYDI